MMKQIKKAANGVRTFAADSKKQIAQVSAGAGAMSLSLIAKAESYIPAGTSTGVITDVKDTLLDVTTPMFPIITAVAIGMAALSFWSRGLSKAKIR